MTVKNVSEHSNSVVVDVEPAVKREEEKQQMKKDRAKKPGKQKIELACDEADAEDLPQE